MKKNHSKSNTSKKFFRIKFINIVLVVLLVVTTAYIHTNFQIYTKYPFISAYINIKPQPTILPEFKILPTKNWKKFTTPDGSISFEYPPYSQLMGHRAGSGATINFNAKETSTPTGVYVNILKYDGNIYNRPLEKYLTDEKFFSEKFLEKRDDVASEVLYIKNIPFKIWYSKDIVEARTVVGITQYNITLGINPQDVGPKSPEFIYQEYLPEFLTILNSVEIESPENTETVFVQDGDIFIRKDGNVQQLTHSGNNFKPVLSPTGARVAFLSEIPETVLNQTSKNLVAYIDPFYTIKAVTSDGGPEIQISGTDGNVARKIIEWKDDTTLVYQEGGSTVRAYSFMTNSNTTIAGPETPDTESSQYHYYSNYLDSAHNKYIIFKNGRGTEQVIQVVDLDTFTVEDFNKQFANQDCFGDRYYQDEKLFTFICGKIPRAPDGEKTQIVSTTHSNVHYNLETGDVTVLPYSDTNK